MTGDLFIQRGLFGDGSQRIGAGKIDQLNLMLGCCELPLFTFDGDAGPVAYALTRAGQLVEQRGFPELGLPINPMVNCFIIYCFLAKTDTGTGVSHPRSPLSICR